MDDWVIQPYHYLYPGRMNGPNGHYRLAMGNGR